MPTGIDIYRYQTVTDPAEVRRAGVSFAWVKGTDGGGQAPVRADHQVRQMKQAGIPVGLYHYAQLTPSPEAQADRLTEEVRRLDAGQIPPALDLEDPHRPGPAAAEFARRFLRRLKANGFRRVVLYANTSMLTGINADAIRGDVGDVVIWAANYGPNNGHRNPYAYRGWVDVHQYTSVGVWPGISGRVDLNYSANLDWVSDNAARKDDMEQSDTLKFWHGGEISVGKALAETWQLACNITGTEAFEGRGVDLPDWVVELQEAVAALRADIAELKARPQYPAPDVDEKALAAELEARGVGGVDVATLVDILNSGQAVRYSAPAQDGGTP